MKWCTIGQYLIDVIFWTIFSLTHICEEKRYRESVCLEIVTKFSLAQMCVHCFEHLHLLDAFTVNLFVKSGAYLLVLQMNCNPSTSQFNPCNFSTIHSFIQCALKIHRKINRGFEPVHIFVCDCLIALQRGEHSNLCGSVIKSDDGRYTKEDVDDWNAIECATYIIKDWIRGSSTDF